MSILANIVNAIRALVGGRVSQADLEASLDREASVFPEKLDWRNSVVDLMKLVHMDSSLANREALAKELGYPGPFDGSAAMNIYLHQQIMDRLKT